MVRHGLRATQRSLNVCSLSQLQSHGWEPVLPQDRGTRDRAQGAAAGRQQPLARAATAELAGWWGWRAALLWAARTQLEREREREWQLLEPCPGAQHPRRQQWGGRHASPWGAVPCAPTAVVAPSGDSEDRLRLSTREWILPSAHRPTSTRVNTARAQSRVPCPSNRLCAPGSVPLCPLQLLPLPQHLCLAPGRAPGSVPTGEVPAGSVCPRCHRRHCCTGSDLPRQCRLFAGLGLHPAVAPRGGDGRGKGRRCSCPWEGLSWDRQGQGSRDVGGSAR